VYTEIVHKHGKFLANTTWDSICTTYTASIDFVCDATMKLLTLASSFNGDNWPRLDTERGLILEAASDFDLTIDNLIAMPLLQGIQMAGQRNNSWAVAHLELIKMKSKIWHKDASGKPDWLKIINTARNTVKILDQSVDYQPQQTNRFSAIWSGQPSEFSWLQM